MKPTRFVVAFGLMCLFAPAMSSKAAAQSCLSVGASGGSPSTTTCNGTNPSQFRYTTVTFNMSASVTCPANAYYGGSWGNQQNVSAIGQCGNAGENETPQCPGSVSTFASPVSFSNNTFTWTVSTQSNSYNGSECVLISPVFQDISTYAEECNGGTCCGGEAVSVCTHNHGTFYDCYCNWSPIIITTDDNRIRLTSIQHGVLFDLIPDGHPEPVSWTRAESDDAFLALDRNHNGLIDDSRELFGTTTNQPPNPDRNGFLALAVFDENGDGRIDSHDAIFAQLVLWFDRNHNGRSEPGELVSLAEAGVVSINLHYHISNRTDEHGNHFRYVSDVRQRVGDHVITRRAIDVLLATP